VEEKKFSLDEMQLVDKDTKKTKETKPEKEAVTPY